MGSPSLQSGPNPSLPRFRKRKGFGEGEVGSGTVGSTSGGLSGHVEPHTLFPVDGSSSIPWETRVSNHNLRGPLEIDTGHKPGVDL